MKLDILYKH